MTEQYLTVETITVELVAVENGDLQVRTESFGNESLVTQLGMLEMAKDTMMRDAMGEIDD